MLAPQIALDSIEIILNIILNQYLNDSYCLTIVSERPLNFEFSLSFTYIVPSDNGTIFDQLLDISEKGCSDYVIRIKEPKRFLSAFEKIVHVGNTRRSDKKLIFLPLEDNVYNRNVLLDILSRKEINFVANVLLVVPSSEQSPNCMTYDLVTHKFIGEDGDLKKPKYLDQWNSCTRKYSKNAYLFPHDMKNMYGRKFKVATFTYKPYIILDLDTEMVQNGRDGTEVRLVDEFCKWVNCTVEIINEGVHQWGEIYENQTGIGIFGSILNDVADAGVAALFSWYEQYLHFDFSAGTIRSAVSCIAPSPRLLASWATPLLPFSQLMWLAMVITFIFSSIALTIAQGCSSNKAFLATLGMIIGQGQNDRGSWRIRSVTGVLLMAGLILSNAYGAGLASTFTVLKYEKPIDTIKDIVDNGIEWGATHDAWVYSLTLSEEPLIKKLVGRFRSYSAEELKRKSFTRSMAYSVEKLPAGYFAIGEYITAEAALNLRLMKDDLYYDECVVMLRKSSPYTSKMSDLIGRLHESGLMLAWETQVALKYLNYKVQLEVKLSRTKKEVAIKPLQFRHVVGIFYMYFTGILLSAVIFILELLKKMYSDNVQYYN